MNGGNVEHDQVQNQSPNDSVASTSFNKQQQQQQQQQQQHQQTGIQTREDLDERGSNKTQEHLFRHSPRRGDKDSDEGTPFL